ncbi:MAG: hypothetical protein A3J24_09895 [Deltaproteobacteria bacterium RIFCSPLOWO2_02_FULL_53_8]|nr:MAG: hypothetical protein A3J24_09895 [Deltaproteobacteria bacterium RIFCSPLOWO2_02_FULL_53_8]
MFLMGPPVDQVEHFQEAIRPGRVWGVVKFLMNEPGECIAGSGRNRSPRAFYLAGSTFETGSADPMGHVRKKKAWSKAIPRYKVSERQKLAYALRLVRKELRTVEAIETMPTVGQ